jgi:hypothetical protein
VEWGDDHLATGGTDPVDVDVLTDGRTDEADDCPSIEEAFGFAPSDAAASDDENGHRIQIEEDRVRKSAAVRLHSRILRVIIGQFLTKPIILVGY